MLGAFVLVGGFYALNAYIYNEKQGDGTDVSVPTAPTGLTGGGWTWVRTELADGDVTEAPAGGQFVLSLDEDGRVASATDCNSMAGSYVMDGDMLTFGPFAMTKMYCEGSMEGVYAEQLSRTASYAVEEGNLSLLLADGAGVMTFTR